MWAFVWSSAGCRVCRVSAYFLSDTKQIFGYLFWETNSVPAPGLSLLLLSIVSPRHFTTAAFYTQHLRYCQQNMLINDFNIDPLTNRVQGVRVCIDWRKYPKLYLSKVKRSQYLIQTLHLISSSIFTFNYFLYWICEILLLSKGNRCWIHNNTDIWKLYHIISAFENLI